jgi:hypothetical protein
MLLGFSAKSPKIKFLQRHNSGAAHGQRTGVVEQIKHSGAHKRSHAKNKKTSHP